MTSARAAVLVPVYEAENEPYVVLTRRTDQMPTHQGQISFPGGRFDPDRDDGLLATALREAEEEIGLHPSQVRIVGALGDTRTLSSGFLITPFVGQVPPSYRYRACAAEVAEVLRLPLSLFRDPKRRQEMDWNHEGHTWHVPVVRHQGHAIWGVTLRIVDLLIASPLLESIDRGNEPSRRTTAGTRSPSSSS